MAESPSHRFGQYLGELLEALFLPEVKAFCQGRDLYLDCGGPRPIRPGRKLTWADRYGNNHDLDFVIEKGGAAERQGRPLAFIEAAWRRYTKHSKNKAQEIQGAVLPIAEKYDIDRPFLGAVLAGEFTGNSIEQLRSVGFTLVHIPYRDIVGAFGKVGIDVAFDEGTPDSWFHVVLRRIEAAGPAMEKHIIATLRDLHRGQFDTFFERLHKKLARHVEGIGVTALFGQDVHFVSVDDAVGHLQAGLPPSRPGLTFLRHEISVRYSNGDHIRASFADPGEAVAFLRYAAAQ